MPTAARQSPSGPGAWTGAVVGALLTAPLTAIFYLGWKTAGLPFVPFDLFDWTARRLPGPVVTWAIEAMVALIRMVGLGSTDVVAKSVEKIMAVMGVVLAGAGVGAVLFAMRGAPRTRPGVVMGTVAGVASGLISRPLAEGWAPDVVGQVLWVLAVWVSWGAAIDMVRWHLRDRRAVPLDATRGDAPPAELLAVERLDRRRFLIRLGGAAAAITVSGAAVGLLAGSRRPQETVRSGRWSEEHALPNAGAAVRPVPGTRPEFTPLDEHYRIDINLLPPILREDAWVLAITGLVNRPLRLTLADLRTNFRPMHQFVTLACISNEVGGDLIGTTRWTGVSLRRLLPHLGLRPEATHLKITSADGFYEIVALETVTADERVMLTYDWDGVPLPNRHGFPLRIYIPDRYGMKQPKWITSIEAIDHWEAGYWVVRGWDRDALMKATAVIDTVALDQRSQTAEGRTLVPVGGIAHGGARGISKVEVRVDDGAWEEAQLRSPLSETTWVLWRYEWPFQEGSHLFTVRCYDAAGTPQIDQPSPPHPAGASGLHSVRAGR